MDIYDTFIIKIENNPIYDENYETYYHIKY